MPKKVFVVLLISLVVIVIALSLWMIGPFSDHKVGQQSARQANQADVTLPATPTNYPPTPTETLLPMRPLPSPELTMSAIQSWIEAPTYAEESIPGYDFKLNFDPSIWALTYDDMGNTALYHRDIPYCKIIPIAGRGTPRDWTVDDQFRTLGSFRYEVVTLSQGGAVRFINYFGGDGIILTGFQVSSQALDLNCYPAAETVLATLASSPAAVNSPMTITPNP
jgi:hypothetical protein